MATQKTGGTPAPGAAPMDRDGITSAPKKDHGKDGNRVSMDDVAIMKNTQR